MLGESILKREKSMKNVEARIRERKKSFCNCKRSQKNRKQTLSETYAQDCYVSSPSFIKEKMETKDYYGIRDT